MRKLAHEPYWQTWCDSKADGKVRMKEGIAFFCYILGHRFKKSANAVFLKTASDHTPIVCRGVIFVLRQ